jgi:PTS system galactitol-specific IIA component
MALLLFEEDILLQMKVHDHREALQYIAQHLYNENKVKADYEAHLLSREKNYPTGLKLDSINIAIPHTDFQFANTTQLVIATFLYPIPWFNMENPNETILVSAAIISLFNKPEHQIKILQQIMRIIQNKEYVAKIVNAKSPQQVIEVFKQEEG